MRRRRVGCMAVTDSSSVAVAATCTVSLLYRRGELHYLFDRRFAPRMLAMSMAGTVTTSLTLIYGLRHIDAVAGTILLQTEPIYSLLLATIVQLVPS